MHIIRQQPSPPPGLTAARHREFARGAFLIEAETAANCVYLIAEGQVRCFVLSEDGCETTTIVLGPGHLVGVEGLLGRDQRSMFVEALTPGRAWSIPSTDLIRQLRIDSTLLGLLVGSLAQRFAFVQGLLRDVLLLTVQERLENVQQRLHVTLRGEPAALSRARLAELVQARPETLTRIPRGRSCGQGESTSGGCGTEVVEFHAGDLLANVDPRPGCIHQVIEGELQIALSGLDSKRELTAQTVGRDEFFGFSALVGMRPPGLKATATRGGKLRSLSAEQFLCEVAQDPSSLERLVQQLAKSVAMMEHQLSTWATRSVRERVLAELAGIDAQQPDPGDPIRVDSQLSHTALARRVGSSRETVTRALAALERDGLVLRDGKRAACSHAAPTLRREHARSQKHPRTHSAAAPLTVVPIILIDEPLPQDNARTAYRSGSIAELAASIRQEGILQPVCVRPEGERFRLVFGLRRLRAARMAGLIEVPCTIRVFDDDRSFLVNLIENLHRQQLSGPERVRAIERLAATGLGVRAIARRTGFDASTISRWLRIGEDPLIRQAVEDERIDVTRAKILVQAPKQELPSLLARAPSISVPELRARVASSPAASDPTGAGHRALELLRSIAALADEPLVEALANEVQRLRLVLREPELRSA